MRKLSSEAWVDLIHKYFINKCICIMARPSQAEVEKVSKRVVLSIRSHIMLLSFFTFFFLLCLERYFVKCIDFHEETKEYSRKISVNDIFFSFANTETFTECFSMIRGNKCTVQTSIQLHTVL